MKTKEEYIARLRKAAPYIKSEYGVKQMCLFGSIARGENKSGSDVDIFVDMPPKAFKYFGLCSFLQELLGEAVDVVRNHSKLDTFFLNEIKRDGISIFG